MKNLLPYLFLLSQTSMASPKVDTVYVFDVAMRKFSVSVANHSDQAVECPQITATLYTRIKGQCVPQQKVIIKDLDIAAKDAIELHDFAQTEIEALPNGSEVCSCLFFDIICSAKR